MTVWQFRLESISEDVTVGCIIRCLVSVAMTTRDATIHECYQKASRPATSSIGHVTKIYHFLLASFPGVSTRGRN